MPLAAGEPDAQTRRWLETIHDGAYLDRAEETCRAGAPILDAPDVGIGPESAAIARLAVTGALAAVDAVLTDRVDSAFAAVRPPGHHAERREAMGFCLFNTIAVAARYAQERHGRERVAILDWDVHHGNGTQHAFEADPTVLYLSLHQSPLYPGTGAAGEEGTGAGAGATLNVPLPAGCGDAEYASAFRERVLPKLQDFHPDLLLISAGFDAHAADPLAGMRVTEAGFAEWTARVAEVAETVCDGRIVSLLEGGYDLDALGRSVAAHLDALTGAPTSPAP